MKRVDVKAILRDRRQRRELLIRSVVTLQAREGITTTRRQAEIAVDRILSTSP